MILVTGATGHVGGLVALLLAKKNLPLRLLVKDTSKLPPSFGDLRAEICAGEYGDGASMERAFKDVSTAFLISASAPPMERAELHREVFATAERMKVGHVVYLSLQGSAESSEYPFARDHWDSEQHLRASGLPCTILRNGKYTEQLTEPELVDRAGVLRGPANGKKIAWISRADSARVIAAIVARAPGGIVTYTGPEALTLEETAARLSNALGKKIPFEATTPEEARGRMLAHVAATGAPKWRAELAEGTCRAIIAGDYAEVHDAQLIIGNAESIEDTVRSGALDDLRKRGDAR